MSHSSSSIESHDLHTYRTNLFSILNQENPPKGLLFQPNSSPWIFDCGAINTMTYNSSDLINTTPTTHTQIQTANRDCVSVTKTGTVEISPSINLRNCLLIPSLTHKLYLLVNWLKSLIVRLLWLLLVVLCRMLRSGRLLGVVLRKEAYTMWTRRLKKVTRRLIMGLLIIDCGCGTNI